MSPLGYLLLAIIIALPVAWLVAEFRRSRPLRISLGLLAIGVVAFSTWGVTTMITTIDYNAWYGGATGDFIKTSLHQIEDGHGLWLVINDLGRPFDIIRSGDPPTAMHSVSVSPDFTVLKFKEENQWAHTLTLKNKYEATHEWFDLAKGAVWKTDTMHKLIRASDDQKRMTQQTARASASQPIRSETN